MLHDSGADVVPDGIEGIGSGFGSADEEVGVESQKNKQFVLTL
jgi:hypothetical protein